MRKLFFLAALIPSFAFAANHDVEMKSIDYAPRALTISVGDEVTWKNVSYTDHSATADDGKAFDTGMVKPKTNSKAVKFEVPGTYGYHCSMHGRTMSGTITVQAK